MKKRFPKHVRFVSVICCAVWALGPGAAAQTPAELDLHLYTGLTITGAVGTVYSVEYVKDLAKTNTPNAWRCLDFLQLPASPYLWTDNSAPATRKRFYRAVAMEAPTNMVFIPPGTFRMGSPTNEVDRNNDEGPQTAVSISHGFWMGKFVVTQREYQTVIGSNSSNQFIEDPDLPVDKVNWSDAIDYCDRLTHQEQAAGRIAINSVYRLPTEAEWEYACRAWTSTRFSYGDDPGYANVTNYAWYGDNSGPGGRMHPVGRKLPNPWGFYDMNGDVWEWCWDYYGTYAGGIAVDPLGTPDDTFRLLHRVLRGSAYPFSAWDCRSARRAHAHPGDRLPYFGFRIVLAPLSHN